MYNCVSTVQSKVYMAESADVLMSNIFMCYIIQHISKPLNVCFSEKYNLCFLKTAPSLLSMMSYLFWVAWIGVMVAF